MTALRAEGVPRIPVEERAGLGEDGGLRGRKGHVEASFDELETSGLHLIDDGCGLGFDGAFGGDVESEEGGATVDGPFEAVFLALV